MKNNDEKRCGSSQTFRTMQLSSVLMAPARHMYVRLGRREDNVITVGHQQHRSVPPSLAPSSGFVPLTIWLPSAAFRQVGPVASFGQRPAKVAHPPPTLQIKGEKKREKDKQLFD